MDKTRVLIVEDQVLTARSMEAMIQDHGMEVIALCKSGEDAVRIAETTVPDIVIMDIRLAGKMSGIETARALQEIHPTPIIYLSDYTDKATVRKAKETHPANFLAKPFNQSDLLRAIDLAISNANHLKSLANTDDDFVFVKSAGRYTKLHYNEIIYIEADRAYCTVHSIDKSLDLSMSMATLFDQINPNRFVKVHRSYIVNLRKVTDFTGNELTVAGHKIPVSDQHRSELMKRLNILH